MQRRLFWALLAVCAIADVGAQRRPQTRESHDLPPSDFIWHWGEAAEDLRRESADFHVAGIEAGFQCELKGRLLASSKGAHLRFSADEITGITAGLRKSFFFIFDASAMMNSLGRDLDWATLECARPNPTNTRRQADQREQFRQELDRRRERNSQTDD